MTTLQQQILASREAANREELRKLTSGVQSAGVAASGVASSGIQGALNVVAPALIFPGPSAAAAPSAPTPAPLNAASAFMALFGFLALGSLAVGHRRRKR